MSDYNRWGFEEINCLLSLCIDLKVLKQIDGKKKRQKEIFSKIHIGMREKGFKREINQIILKYTQVSKCQK